MTKEENIVSIFKARLSFNVEEYIVRKDIQNKLLRFLARYRYIFMSGESGCGKTWLTKYILREEKNKFINLAEIKLKGGFLQYFRTQVGDLMVGRDENKRAGLGALGLDTGLEVSKTYEHVNDYLDLFLNKHRKHIIVLDNFESIINDKDILDDLSCIITMADDPKIIDYDVKFIIIGATSDLTRYFQEMPNYQTIANRVQIFSISGFNDTECMEYVSSRFRDCGFDIIEPYIISEDIRKWTDGLPQSVGDLCYEIAISFHDALKEKIKYGESEYDSAVKNWISSRLAAEYTLINGLYNDNISNAKQNNYILYALKKYKCTTFSYTQIQAYIDELTPYKQVKGLTKTGIKKYLERLADIEENRNILVQVGPETFKVKSYKTYACIEFYVVIEDEEIRFKEAV